jgi:Domain of unknown function (DUF1906)
MRRAIAAAVTGGLVLGGALATPAFAAAHGAGKPSEKTRQAAPEKTLEKKGTGKSAKKAKTTAKAVKTIKAVVYGGYEFQVPADWLVYRLDQHPQTCVRYDQHAVYLGAPGTSMRCPAGLVGRTETVSFAPGNGAASASGGAVSQPDGASREIERLSAVSSVMTQDSTLDELRVGLGSGKSGATVTGTYGTDPAVVKQVLATLRTAPAGTRDTAQSAPAAGGGTSSSLRAALNKEHAAAAAPAPAAAASPSPTYTSWKGVPPHWPIEIIQPTPTPTPTPTPVSKPTGGFDACTAPALTTMSAWRNNFADVGVYIGGANSACAAGNLTASWAKSVAAMGYGMLPTYVGRQAPCWGGNGLLITASSAAAQGTSAGADAVTDAQSFGLPKGSPIYYDMEAYRGSTSCTTAVLNFLGAWDRRVVAGGYVTGVYSSEDSGITDMQAADVAKTAGFTPPDAVWIALWDNQPTLSVGTLAWPLTDRDKQYSGNVNETVAGITLNIDKDVVGGPVAR